MPECLICHIDFQRFKSQRQFNRHQVNCQKYQKHIKKQENGKFKCKECQKEFTRMRTIFGHLTKVHFKEGNRGIAVSARHFRKCHFCDRRCHKKNINKHEELCALYSKHIDIIHEDGKWACKFCGQLMKNQSSMFRHLAKKHAALKSKESKENLAEFSDEEDVDGVYEDFGHLEDHGEGYVDDHVNIDDTFEIKNESDLPLTQPIKLRIQKIFSSGDQSLKEPSNADETVQDSQNEDNSLTDFPGSIFHVCMCEMCDTPFINQDCVTDHLKTYHKYQKDCSNFIRIKKL